jgi:hypothetical protein
MTSGSDIIATAPATQANDDEASAALGCRATAADRGGDGGEGTKRGAGAAGAVDDDVDEDGAEGNGLCAGRAVSDR